jgi:hypothetical protein
LKKVSKDLASALAKVPEDEHVPVHAYMMAVSIKMICSTQFGAFFKDDASIRKFHSLYDQVKFKIATLLCAYFQAYIFFKYLGHAKVE